MSASNEFFSAINFDANRLIAPSTYVTGKKILPFSAMAGETALPTSPLPLEWAKDRASWSQMVRTEKHCSIDHTFQVRWSAPTNVGAYYEVEDYGEVWTSDYYPNIAFVNEYDPWDKRTLNLHPAVAGLSMTAAGFDQAYLQALSSAGHMFGNIQRNEIFQTARDHIGRMLDKSISPFRLLVRGVNMWLSLKVVNKGKNIRTSPVRVGQMTQPINLASPGVFNGFLTAHSDRPVDVIYVPIYGGTEIGIIQALDAMCCAELPIPGAPPSLRSLWPSMRAPRVAFNGPWTVDEVGVPLSSDDVWNALTRFCETYDCWDLLKEALDFVSFFYARPPGVALWMGRNGVVVGLPESQLAAGAIGPLFNGTSAEAMRTAGFHEPDWKELLIEGSLRAMSASAASACILSRSVEYHYCNTQVQLPKASTLHRAHELTYARTFMQMVAGVTETFGWKGCIGRSLKGLRPIYSRHQAKMVLDPLRYCGLATLLPWMPALVEGSCVSGLLKPAVPSPVVPENQWMPISAIGVVGASQLEAAAWLLPMDVRFVVLSPNGTQQTVDLNASLNRNRSSPMLAPKLRTAGFKITTFVRVRNIRKYFKAAEKCVERNKSVAHVVLPQLDPVSELFFEDADDFNLGSGPYGGRPLTNEDLGIEPSAQGAGSASTSGTPLPQAARPQPRPPPPPPPPGRPQEEDDAPKPLAPGEHLPPEVPHKALGGKQAEAHPDEASHDALHEPTGRSSRDQLFAHYVTEMKRYKMLPVDVEVSVPERVTIPASKNEQYWFKYGYDELIRKLLLYDPIIELAKVPMQDRNRMARVGANMFKFLMPALEKTKEQEEVRTVSHSYDALARATFACPALNAAEYEEWTCRKAPPSYNDDTIKKFLLAGGDLLEVMGIPPGMKADAAERLERAGEVATAKRLLQVIDDMKKEAALAQKETAEGTTPEPGSVSAATDAPGEEENKADFGPATSPPDLKPASSESPVSDVAEEAGTKPFVMEFSDPSASQSSKTT